MELPQHLRLVCSRALAPSQRRNFPEVQFETPKVQFDVITHWCIICCYWNELIPASFVIPPPSSWGPLALLFPRLNIPALSTSPCNPVPQAQDHPDCPLLDLISSTFFLNQGTSNHTSHGIANVDKLFHSCFPKNDEMVLKASLKLSIHSYSPPVPTARHFITEGNFITQAKLDFMNLWPFPGAFLPCYMFGVAPRGCTSRTSAGFKKRLTEPCSPQRQAQHWPHPQGQSPCGYSLLNLSITASSVGWIPSSCMDLYTQPPEQSLMLAASLRPRLLGHTLSSGEGRQEYTSAFPHVSSHLIVSLTFRSTVLTMGCLLWEYHTWCCLVSPIDPWGWEREAQGCEAS